MEHWFFGALAGFLIGGVASFLNYYISQRALRKKPQTYFLITVLRQLIHIMVLVGLYFLAPFTPWGLTGLLVGGVIGITIPMFFYTVLLVRVNDEAAGSSGNSGKDGQKDSEKTNSDGKGED